MFRLVKHEIKQVFGSVTPMIREKLFFEEMRKYEFWREILRLLSRFYKNERNYFNVDPI